MEVRLYQNLVELNWNLLFSLITFVVLVLILKKFFFEKVHNFMEERSKAVSDQLDHAAEMEKAADEKLKNYEATLNDADEEGRRIIRDARANAGKQAEEIVDQAKVEAESIISDARKQADSEVKKAMSDMKEQVAELAITAAEQILGKELETTGHDEIIDKVIEEAGKEEWQI